MERNGQKQVERLPGIADALQARLVERAGFSAAFLSGFRERALTPPKRAEAIGFKLALFGIALLSVQVRAMRDALALMREGGHPGWDRLIGFDELYERIGFDDYYALEKRYAAE